jgi:DNA invertase Pin-like site-specific DNA recombinase
MPKNGPSLAVVYERVSSRPQAKNFSFTSQDGDLDAYCEKESLPIGKRFRDVGSGLSTKNRSGFLGMIEYALDKSIGVTDVVFPDVDRFTRNTKQFFEFTEKLVEAGITLHSARDDEKYDLSSEHSWHQKAVAAQAESRKISKRTKGGQSTATGLGRQIGPPPWGYKIYHGPGEEEICGTLIPDPDLWPHVLKLWEMAAERRTPMPIATHFNQQGIPGPGGEIWTDENVLYILKNRKYSGCQFRGAHPESRLPGLKDETPVIITENAHEAAVTPEVWAEIQDMIKGRRRGQSSPRSHSSPNLLSELVKCGECKTEHKIYNMTVSRKDGVARLICALKRRATVAACPNGKNVRMDQLVPAVIDRVNNHILTPETLQNAVQAMARDSRNYLTEGESRRSDLKTKLKDVEEGIKNVNDVVKMQGTKISETPSLMDSLAGLEKEKRELVDEINQITDDTNEARLYVTNPEGIIATALDLKTYTESKDPEAVKQILNMFIDRVEVYRDHAEIYYKISAHSEESAELPGVEIISFDKKGRPLSAESCLLEGSTGPRPGRRRHGRW